MEHETVLEYTGPLLREAVWAFWRRSVGVGILIALTACAAMLAFLLVQGDRSWIVGVLAAVLFFGAMFVAAIYFVHYRNTLRRFHDLGTPRATLRATKDSFTVSSGAGSSTMPWSMVIEVWKFRNCWLLLFSKAQFITLPLASLSEEARAFVHERVVAAGGKVDG
jgi:hypothetical protein